MITLKGPLQLYTTNPVTTYSDQLGSKILGNYQLMSLAITPQDLLHMTMQEPEVYIEQEPGGTVLVENHISNYHQDNLEFINQFINRIMLVDTPQFTYQDEVFVSTVLQKLGITNISEFISQIKMTKEHTELMQNLVNQYFAVGAEVKETAQKVLEKDYIKEEKETILGSADNTNADAFYMNIVKRLQVARTNNILYEFRKPTAAEIMFNHDTMMLMPFIEQSDLIELQQLRNQIFGQQIENVLPQLNIYESKNFGEGEITEQYVTEALSSAILFNLIKDVCYEVKQHFHGNQYIWQDYKKVLYGNAMDTFERFEHYQQQEITQLVDKRQYASKMLELYQDEYSLVSMLYRINDYTGEEEGPFETIMEHTYLSLIDNQNLQQILTKQQKITEKLEKNIVNAKYYAEDIALLEPLRQKEETLLLLKEIALDDIGKLRAEQGFIHILSREKDMQQILQQYYAVQEHLIELPAIENVYQTYQKVLRNLRQDIYEGKHIDDIQHKISIIEQLENVHITELKEDVFEINGEELTRNQFVEYMTQLLMQVETREQSGNLAWISYYSSSIKQQQFLEAIKQQYEEWQTVRNQTQNEQHHSHLMELENQILQFSDVQNGNISEEVYQTYLLEHSHNVQVIEKIRQENLKNRTQIENQYQILLKKKYTAENVQNKIEVHEPVFAEERKVFHLSQQETSEQFIDQLRQEYLEQNTTSVTQLEVSNMEDLEQLTHIALNTANVEKQSMTEEEYRIYLQQINEKNLRMQKILQESVLPKQTSSRVVVDRKQALKQSLRALENPEEVLKEIHETAKPIEKEVPARIRQYLELTDEKTRVMLEEIMGIRHHIDQIEHTKDVQATVSTVEQILRREQQRIDETEQVVTGPQPMPEAIRELLLNYMEQIDLYEQQGRVTRYDVENTLKTVEHKVTDHVTNIDNHVLELIKAPIADVETMKREDIVVFEQKTQSEITRMVHKEKQQIRDEIKEEVLNSLDRIQINHTQEINYEQVEQMTQKQIEETKREIIKRQQETIQEIVNRNLLSQMGTISDKVYKDIERKLQSERRRRGY